ncbi:MAG: hypothetical protein ACRDHZ_06720, partial [Ktedonobacteraceae bacterium]
LPRRPHSADEPPALERRARLTDEHADTSPRQRAGIEPDHSVEPDGLKDRSKPKSRTRDLNVEPSGSLPLGSPIAPQRHKRSPLALLVGLALPVILILLLFLSHAFGLNLLPIGIPGLGTAPVATITLTVQTKQLSDTFLLTALPQIAQANLATHVLPDRSISATASASRSVATSGQRTIPGTQASGTLLFSNSSLLPVNVADGTIFTTRTSMQVRLTHAAIVVPARIGSTNGTIEAPGVAVTVGQTGNLPPNALNVPCCNNPRVTVSNPAAFSGGSDAHTTHLVAQSDLDGVRDALLVGLQQQVLQRIDGLLTATEVRAGAPSYSSVITSNQPVGSAATQVNVNVSLNVSVLVYDTRLASDLARQLLSNEATQTLGNNYQVRGGLNIAAPLVEQQGTNGQLYLSVVASGLWAYKVTASIEQTWRQAIKGASLPLAQSYLATRPGISAAHIALPFGSDHLPVDERQVVFVVD